MSKAVMISIRPKWCEMIASGEKTIEVRKTRPNIEVPFKCYIYCTKGDHLWLTQFCKVLNDKAYNRILDDLPIFLNGKVIGEFICNRIDRYTDEVVNACSTEDYSAWNDFELEKTCIHPDDIEKYADGNDLYGWHISDLVIYDQPKELSEFCTRKSVFEFGSNGEIRYSGMTRPPQSWYYVEEGINHAKAQ